MLLKGLNPVRVPIDQISNRRESVAKGVSHRPILELPQMIFVYRVHDDHWHQRFGRFDFDDDMIGVVGPPDGEGG